MSAAQPEAGAVAMKGFNRIADAWKLSRADRQKLLAISARTADRSRDPGKAHPSHDQLERISYILGIYAGLSAIFENSPLAVEWVLRENADFGGTRPLDRFARRPLRESETRRSSSLPPDCGVRTTPRRA